MKISKHGKIRMKERTSYNHKERHLLFRYALIRGKNPQDIKDEKLRNYMKSKQGIKGSNIKLYKDYVFIYSKHGKRLYTMYKLPEHFLEREK